MTQIVEKVINGESHTRDSIVEKHAGLVHSVCHKLINWARNVGHEYDDLVSIGFMGLIKAFDYFDGERFPVRFSTYAVPMIRGEIQKVLRDSGTGVHYSRGIKDLAFNIKKRELDELSVDEIAVELGEDRKKVIHAFNFLQHGIPSSLNQPIRVSEVDSSVADIVGKPDDTTELFVNDFLESLEERERYIAEGLMDGRTQADIGRSLGIGQVQVSRVLRTIRRKYEDHSKGKAGIQEKVSNSAPAKDVKKVITKQKTVEITEEAVNQMRSEGKTYADIANEFDVSPSTISYHIQKWKVEKVREKNNKKRSSRPIHKQRTIQKEDREKSDVNSNDNEKIAQLEKELEEKETLIQEHKNKINHIKSQLTKALGEVAELTAPNKINQEHADDQKLLALLLERESNRMKSLLKIG